MRLIPQAHAVVFILAADTGVTKSDLQIWREHLIAEDNEAEGCQREGGTHDHRVILGAGLQHVNASRATPPACASLPRPSPRSASTS